MTNLEHYEKELKENGRDEYPCTMFTIREDLSDEEDEQEICDHKCQECFIKSIKWFGQQYHEPVLTREEKVIVKDIINALKPFNLKFTHITKNGFSPEKKEYLSLIYDKDDKYFWVELPKFESDEKFVDMELNKSYTLEELGL